MTSSKWHHNILEIQSRVVTRLVHVCLLIHVLEIGPSGHSLRISKGTEQDDDETNRRLNQMEYLAVDGDGNESAMPSVP